MDALFEIACYAEKNGLKDTSSSVQATLVKVAIEISDPNENIVQMPRSRSRTGQ